MSARRAATRRKGEKDAAEKKPENYNKWAESYLDEAAAILCLAVAVFLLASFVSQVFLFSEGNWMGPIGHVVGTLLTGFMGWCALVPVLCLFWFSYFLWTMDQSSRKREFNFMAFPGFIGVLFFSCVLVSIFWGEDGGGKLGVLLSSPLEQLFSRFGAAVISFSMLLLCLAFTTQLSAAVILKGMIVYSLGFIGFAFKLPVIIWHALVALSVLMQKVWLSLWPDPQDLVDEIVEEESRRSPKPRVRRNVISAEESSEEEDASDTEDEENENQDDQLDDPPTHIVVARRPPPSSSTAREYIRENGERHEKKSAAKESRDSGEPTTSGDYSDYKAPPLSLLARGEPPQGAEDDNELREKSRQIESKLRDFGVLGKVTHVHPGPVITLFEFEPAAGVKVGRIAALQDDLAMTLRASSIRIIAPIPKRGTVGIEVPNKHRDLVRLRDVLESDAFVHAESTLNVCIGKDTYGEAVVADISTMPHLLMAGATGTGKSVCINAVLLSLLYRCSPDELGLILIDPKILELSVYEGIPHLRVPVVTNPRQARAVLQWAVDEMHRRYKVMQRFGVRGIDNYNMVALGEEERDEPRKGALKGALDQQVVMLSDDEVVEEGTLAGGEEDLNGEVKQEPIAPEKLKPLPKIVIVIDELADLMLSVGRDIEELVTRLAQKARAAGIHLIVATQRPSVDVITGLIKANFPARLPFRVSSRIDSRTILDSMGAERLLGRGDMLLMLPGAESLRRVHGAFVSDNEVKRVVQTLKDKCAPQYDERIMQICERALEEENAGREGSGSGEGGDSEYDEMYDKAVELVVEKGQASTSMIQRVFRIGYNRAARIIEMMERDGIVGPMDGVKPREVLLPRQDSQ